MKKIIFVAVLIIVVLIIIVALPKKTVAPVLTEADAIAEVKKVYPDLANYPSDNLPPTRIQTEMVQNGGWRLGFYQLGSGRPGILAAKCFYVSSKRVEQTGEFKAGTTTVEHLYLENCSPDAPRKI